MGYEYSPQSMVNLPVLSTTSAIVLTNELLTAAKNQQATLEASGQSLPTSIDRSLGRLEAACVSLEQAVQPYLSSIDTQAARSADLVLDHAWSGFSDLLTAWSKVQPAFNPDPEGASSLQALLFADGLAFVKLDFKSEWQQSQARLDALEASPYLPALAKLGGVAFVENIRKAHADYGSALGITTVKTIESSPEVREKWRTLQGALRDYITRVVAWADPEEAGSEALVEALLAPLAAWETKASSSSAASSASTTASDTPPPA